MLTANKQKGSYGENIVAGYLENKGYSILERNYKRGSGEIDIIAGDNEYIVFVEVKYRQNLRIGYPRESVTVRKQKAIIAAALCYIGENELDDSSFRFDVAEVFGTEQLEINYIENAFGVSG